MDEVGQAVWSRRSYTTSKREERWCKEVIRAQGREQNRQRPGESPFPVPVSCPPHLSVKCRPAVRRYNAVGWSVGTTAVLKGPHPGAGAAILNPVVLARISNPVVHAARLPQPLMPLGWWRDMDGEESMRCGIAGRARRQGADGWCCRYQVLWLLCWCSRAIESCHGSRGRDAHGGEISSCCCPLQPAIWWSMPHVRMSRTLPPRGAVCSARRASVCYSVREHVHR
jgi:hypothetical protein